MQPRLLRSPARLAGTSLLKLQSDERLVSLASDGHEQAFAAIVERYRTQLDRYATRLVGPSRGEDAVQQAFVNAHAALIADPEKSIELKPWLYRIVHNAALNQLRASRDEQSLGDETDRLVASDDAIERRERLREALEAVAALPPTQRDAILLRELEGRSHEEIALALGVSPGAARQQIFRARAALRTAATALTPQPLIIRMLEMASSGAASGTADLAAGAGMGLTAIIAKAGAGVLVTGAVVGGAAVGTGVVHTPGSESQARPAAKEERVAASSRSRGADGRVVRLPASSTAGATKTRHGGGSGSNSSDDAGGSSKSGRGDDDNSGPGRSGSAVVGAGTTESHRGSSGHGGGDSHRGRGGDDSGHSGSGDDSGHRKGKGKGGSGSSGGSSGGGGSDDAADTPEVENEVDGDVSGKNKGADSTSGGGGTATTPEPAPTTTAPAPSGGGASKGGAQSQVDQTSTTQAAPPTTSSGKTE
jgi:RNA polymerase sigma factor (sigma-70 family)